MKNKIMLAGLKEQIADDTKTLLEYLNEINITLATMKNKKSALISTDFVNNISERYAKNALLCQLQANKENNHDVIYAIYNLQQNPEGKDWIADLKKIREVLTKECDQVSEIIKDELSKMQHDDEIDVALVFFTTLIKNHQNILGELIGIEQNMVQCKSLEISSTTKIAQELQLKLEKQIPVVSDTQLDAVMEKNLKLSSEIKKRVELVVIEDSKPSNKLIR